MLFAHEIRMLYENENMVERGYRMAFVMLNGDHYKAILPSSGRSQDYSCIQRLRMNVHAPFTTLAQFSMLCAF
eukprot:6001215-Prymnesium_polylepis.1